MSATIKAVVCRGFGAGETRLEDVARPELKTGHVRVRLQACGVNFPDALIVQGRYQMKPPLPFTPGMEAAGVVEEASGELTRRPGDRVIVRMRMGAFADEVVVPAHDALPLPEHFSFDEGATFLVAHMTAYHAIVTCGAVKPGQTVVVLGAGGGVGRAAVQIAKHCGATVIAVTSSEAKQLLARNAGADVVINARADDLASEVISATGERGADIVYDPVGVDARTALGCLTWGGRVLIIGFAGDTIPTG